MDGRWGRENSNCFSGRYKRILVSFSAMRKADGIPEDQARRTAFYNYFQKEAIKITDVTYNSPISIGVQGIVDGIVDLAMAKPRYEMERAEHEARQISYLAQGYASIARAAQVVSDPRTPDGIKQYTLGELNKLLIKQGKLNDQLGIIQENIDRKI